MGCGRNSFESSSRHYRRRHEGCICEVVETILELQNHSSYDDDDTCGTSCFLEPLGGINNKPHKNRADTRVFMLLTEDGSPFKVMFCDKEYGWYKTPFFRVEDVFGDCCATLRAIAPTSDAYEPIPAIDGESLDPSSMIDLCHFKKTETCVTVDLSRFAGIQCVADVNLNLKKK
ncbi:MAG: spore coat protein CotZ [Lysinibacillus sp.]|nr:spore coat protein CotZ [Lysinibacillus sp.]